MEKIPKLYMMVGVPGSGKSTWINNQIWAKDCIIISTDYYVEKFARRLKTTYNKCFELVMPRAVRLMVRAVKSARSQNKDIIWDQTSTTVLSRKKKFNMLSQYYSIAVVFKTPTKDELLKRLESRSDKFIPWSVVTNMIDNFENPSTDEGFKEIWITS